MQIGSVRNLGTTTAVRVEGDELVLLPFTVDELLSADRWDEASAGGAERISVEGADWAPLVGAPEKTFCVGMNYREHVAEMGRELPLAPTYFAKFADAFIGARDNIVLPPPEISTHIDYEVELCIVIGTAGRYIDAANALDHVAGYTVLNDVSVRDWQRRTSQFLAGKTFEGLTPVGPVLTTTDELGDGGGLAVRTTLNGVTMQDSTTDELVFTVADIIADLSKITTLRPGDLIATGTPSGVGAARTPPEWLAPGTEVVSSIEGIGELRNLCVEAPAT